MKKIFALVLALVMIVSTMPISVFAQGLGEEAFDRISYHTDDKSKARLTIYIDGQRTPQNEMYMELYDANGNLMSVTTVKDLSKLVLEPQFHVHLTGSCSCHKTTWKAGHPNADVVPAKAKIYRDGVHTGTVDLNIPLSKWRGLSYKVTFDTVSGSTVDTQYVLHNKTVTRPADPEKAGYTFGGWYTDADYTAAFDFATGITGNITLYAKWTAVPAPKLESLASLVNVDGKTVTFNLDPSKEYNVLVSEFSGDEYNSLTELIVNEINANLSQQEVISGPLTDDMIRDYINNLTDESDMRLTCLETGEALVRSYGPVTVSDGALILVVELKSGDKHAYVDDQYDIRNGDYYITYGVHAAFIPAKASTSTTPPGYYPPVDTTPETEIVTPKTADAGILLAVGMSILSVTGSAVLLKKKED